jgi:hypothetical protein
MLSQYQIGGERNILVVKVAFRMSAVQIHCRSTADRTICTARIHLVDLRISFFLFQLIEAMNIRFRDADLIIGSGVEQQKSQCC